MGVVKHIKEHIELGIDDRLDTLESDLKAYKASAVTVSGGGGGGQGGGVANPLTVKDEGAVLTADTKTIDFKGAGVSAALVGETVEVTIEGGGGAGTPDTEIRPVRGFVYDDTPTGETVVCTEANVYYPVGIGTFVMPAFTQSAAFGARYRQTANVAANYNELVLWDETTNTYWDFLQIEGGNDWRNNYVETSVTAAVVGHTMSWRVMSDTPGAIFEFGKTFYVTADEVWGYYLTNGTATRYDFMGLDKALGGYVKDAQVMAIKVNESAEFDASISYHSGTYSSVDDTLTEILPSIAAAGFDVPIDLTFPYKHQTTAAVTYTSVGALVILCGSFQIMGTPVTANGGGGGAVIIQDEGVQVEAVASTLNFKGAGVTAVKNGAVVDITIPGGGAVTGATVIYGTTKAAAPNPALFGEQTFIWFKEEAALAIWDLVGGIAKWRDVGGSVGGNKFGSAKFGSAKFA